MTNDDGPASDDAPPADWLGDALHVTTPRRRLEGKYSAYAWLRKNSMAVSQYAYERWHADERDDRLAELWETNPTKLRALVLDWQRPNLDKARQALDFVARTQSKNTILLGRTGSWKSTTAAYIATYAHFVVGRPVEYLGLQRKDRVPWFARHIVDIKEASPGALVNVEEGGRSYSSRRRKAGSELQDMLTTGRHKGVSTIVQTQNTSVNDIVVSKFVNAIWAKPVSFNQSETERGYVRSLLEEFEEMRPEENPQNFVIGEDVPPMTFELPAPSWWDTKYTLAFEPYTEEEYPEAADLAERCRKAGWDWEDIALSFKTMGIPKPPEWWEDLIRVRNDGRDPLTGETRQRRKRQRADEDAHNDYREEATAF